jgi:hypothetical protein
MAEETKPKLSEVVKDIKKVAEQVNVAPYDLSFGEYEENGGQYTYWHIRQLSGGWPSLIASKFKRPDPNPPEKSPQLRPIVIQISEVKKPEPKKQTSNIKTAMVWPDIQAGFSKDFRTGALTPTHDRQALDVALQITEHVNPERVVFLGDNFDLPDWSKKFVRTPEFYWSTQPAAVELAWVYGKVRFAQPRSDIDYILGNHELRLATLLMTDAVAAYDLRAAFELDKAPLLSISRLLGLEELRINVHGPYPSGEVWLNDNIRLHHGEIVRARSGGTVRAVVDDLRASEGMGHIHRMELAMKTVWTRFGPKTYLAFSPGTLCDIRPGVVPAAKHRNNWQQGIAKIDYEEGDGYFHVTLIPINDGRAIFDRQIFTARPEKEIVEEAESVMNFRLH